MREFGSEIRRGGSAALGEIERNLAEQGSTTVIQRRKRMMYEGKEADLADHARAVEMLTKKWYWEEDEENIGADKAPEAEKLQEDEGIVTSFPYSDPNVSPFQRFYDTASQKLIGSDLFISVPVDAAVFGTDMEIYLDMNDVRCMCSMGNLSENCVIVYIRHLYGILIRRGMQRTFKFIDPALVSSVEGADLSKIITTRLMNTKCEWVFIPFHPDGSHWLLVVIHMVGLSCYWLDPSGLPTRYNIKTYVTSGLKGLQKDGVWRSSPIWYNIKCPKPKNSVECGFYVMKFLRELIKEANMFIRSKPFPNPTYELNEINEVRLEWIQSIEAYL